MIRLQAMKLKASPKYKDCKDIRSFVGSPNWCTRFMDREGLTIRIRTKIAQKLPVTLEDKIMAFYRYFSFTTVGRFFKQAIQGPRQR